MTKELWHSSTSHYLIPKGTPLVAGNMMLTNKSGQQLLVDPDGVSEYLVSDEEVSEYYRIQVEGAISDIGAAFGQLFKAGKEAFLQAMNNTTQNSTSHSSSEEEDAASDQVYTIEKSEEDEEDDEDKEDDEDLFADLKTTLSQSLGEIQNIIQETKEDLQKALATPDTRELMRELGNRLIHFADELEESESEHNSSSDSNEASEESPITDPPLPDDT